MTQTQNFVEMDGIECYAPEVANDYSNYPSEGFDLTDEIEEKSFWVASRARLLKHMIEKLSFKKSIKFLEIGCGTGFFLRKLDSKSIELTGSELYLNGLKYAKNKLPDVKFIQLDATRIPFVNQYNIIGAFDVLEHIKDDCSVISGVHQALKNEGYFIMTVPQYQFMWSQIDDLVNHQRRYSRKELINKLKANGFEVRFVTSFVFMLFPLMLIQRLMDKQSRSSKTLKTDFNKRVNMPRWMNWLFDKVMRIDEFLIRQKISLPFGGSLLVIAQKQSQHSK